MESECRQQMWWRLGGSGVDMGGAGNTSAEARWLRMIWFCWGLRVVYMDARGGGEEEEHKL
jgi:hypothetical protein